MLCVGFVRGWLEIGVTQWALGGRLLGFLVLLGYLSAGYFLVAYFGSRGLRRFIETIAVTAVAIVLVKVILRLTGLEMMPTPNFEGFAGNRNAFVFQLLAVISFLLVYTSTYVKTLYPGTLNLRGALFVLLLATLFLGVIWTGSRAGWGTGAIMILVAWRWRLADRRILGWAIVLMFLLWLSPWAFSYLGSFLSPGVVHSFSMQSALTSESSDHERWRSYIHAMELWQGSPLLGAGLGFFISRSPEWFGYPVVIHSTPLWFLAELGLLGLVAFGGSGFILLRYIVRVRRAVSADRILLLLLLCFAVFGLVHEIFFQRIFWLALGVLLARNYAERESAA